MVIEFLLNGDLMVTGKVVFGRNPVTIQSIFNQIDGTHISVTFQSNYFLKNKITPDAALTRNVRVKWNLQ